MIFVFTLVVTVYSFAHLERFDFGRPEAWVWFVLYIGVCVNAGVHLGLYRTRPLPLPGGRPRGATRLALWVVALTLGLYGLALLAVPAAASSFWPWRLDAFHAQLYSVTFLTPAVGAWVLLRGTTSADQRALGLTLAGWGLLPIVALFLADAAVQRVQWDSPGSWLWLSLFAAMAGVGAWLVVTAGKRRWETR